MPLGKYQPNPNLKTLLVSQGTRFYTVASIRDLMLEVDGEERSSSDIRRWVNGQSQTLLRHGFIESAPKNGKRSQYVNTDKILRHSKSGDYKEGLVNSEILSTQLSMLKSRLRNYQMDIVISAGETKECEEITKLMPAMRSRLQESYNSSKEKNIELIGRIKVLELLISEFS
jgi:hypothetical protein